MSPLLDFILGRQGVIRAFTDPAFQCSTENACLHVVHMANAQYTNIEFALIPGAAHLIYGEDQVWELPLHR